MTFSSEPASSCKRTNEPTNQRSTKTRGSARDTLESREEREEERKERCEAHLVQTSQNVTEIQNGLVHLVDLMEDHVSEEFEDVSISGFGPAGVVVESDRRARRKRKGRGVSEEER